MNEYKVSDRLKVFVFFFTLLQIFTFSSLLLIPFFTLPEDSQALQLYNFCCRSLFLNIIIIVFILAGIITAVLLLINTFKRKVIFRNDFIISKNVFSTQKLRFSEIKGYMIKRSMLYIITNSKERISINLFSLDRTDNLIRNLEMRFTNLDF